MIPIELRLQAKYQGGMGPMDNIVMILFGSVLCTTSALTFMEIRRIRKKLEAK
jgi:hypothetical protein